MSSLLVFYIVYRLEIQSVMLVFSTPVVNKRLSNLLPDSPHIAHNISSSFSLQNFAVSLQCETSEKKYLFFASKRTQIFYSFSLRNEYGGAPYG